MAYSLFSPLLLQEAEKSQEAISLCLSCFSVPGRDVILEESSGVLFKEYLEDAVVQDMCCLVELEKLI